LNGKYTSGQAYGGIASATTFVFSPDGSYTVETVGAVRSGGTGSTSASTTRGAYKVSGNTLELTANGATFSATYLSATVLIPAGPIARFARQRTRW